jgi:prevent-host-death family protein
MTLCLNAAFAFPELLPISDLRQRQNEILLMLGSGPVILTQHGRAAAVMLSPDTWRELLAELEDLRDAVSAAEAYEKARNDPAGLRPWEEVKKELESEGDPDD